MKSAFTMHLLNLVAWVAACAFLLMCALFAGVYVIIKFPAGIVAAMRKILKYFLSISN